MLPSTNSNHSSPHIKYIPLLHPTFNSQNKTNHQLSVLLLLLSRQEKNKTPMAELMDNIYGVPRVVSILSSLLQNAADRNDKAAGRQKPGVASAFQGMSKPSISVQSYLGRIFRYANCSPSCYVVAYIYLDRFLHRNPSVTIDSFNVHRFIITSVLAAVKFMDDIYYNNSYFAKVGGISLAEMNYLEVDFLFGVSFDLNVTPVIFNSFCCILQGEMYTECSPGPPKLICSLSEDESSQQQLAVREVFGT